MVKIHVIVSKRQVDLKDFNSHEDRRAFWEEIKVKRYKVCAETTGFSYGKEQSWMPYLTLHIKIN